MLMSNNTCSKPLISFWVNAVRITSILSADGAPLETNPCGTRSRLSLVIMLARILESTSTCTRSRRYSLNIFGSIDAGNGSIRLTKCGTGSEEKAHHVLITLCCVPLEGEDSEEDGSGSK